MPPLKSYSSPSRAHSPRYSRLDRYSELRRPWRSLQSSVLAGNWQYLRPILDPCEATSRYTVVRKPASDSSVSNSRALAVVTGGSCAQSLHHSHQPNWETPAASPMRRRRVPTLPTTPTIDEHAFRFPPTKLVWLGLRRSLAIVRLHIDIDDTQSWAQRNSFVREPPR